MIGGLSKNDSSRKPHDGVGKHMVASTTKGKQLSSSINRRMGRRSKGSVQWQKSRKRIESSADVSRRSSAAPQ